ncbi:MurR/RpiR family transcriptional regulator [Peribacillus cavernae]|uniref:MurR/RpiR family transcriptional regulator n=1 Tax=Peribacillus cavernae TaxID=1674310 RepID=A0A3S1BBZ1_9BACI|nr:MurR/RpiR family transcriptional regulator [Peribacillus cavernae]MDQ0220758.1 DNA-binding MurR/RpiR family transcriptional regulator [Peribacillus cavernae]RUQ32458.1 MurR/RpiR family transcriptional regulator [Peribacillus cavernae]
MEPINDLIRKNFSTLTNRQKLVASYILNYPHQIAFQTAKELGELTETSETTVIRFCYKIGYTGFSHLQKEIQASLLENRQTDPLEKFRVSKGVQSQNNDLIKYIKEQDIAFIERTMDSLSPDLYEEIISAILLSKKTCVVGSRSSYAPASWLAYSLNMIKGNTHLYRGELDDAISLISEINKKCLIIVIAFSFPRYAQDTITFVKNAKKKGVKILAITDNELSPIGLLADLLVKVYTPSPTGIKGMPMVFSLLNLIVSGVTSSKSDEVEKRLKDYEETSEQFFSVFKNDTQKN